MINSPFPWGTPSASTSETHVTRRDVLWQTGTVNQTYTGSTTVNVGSKTRSALQAGIRTSTWLYPTSGNARITNRSSTLGCRVTRNGVLDTYWYARGYTTSIASYSIGTFSTEFGQMRDQAYTQALERLRDEKMELGVALLEARKSLNHLASTAVRLLEMIRNLRRGRFSAVAQDLGLTLSRRGTKNLAKNWLEYKYAWRPLIMDVSAAYDIAREGLNPRLSMRVERNVQRPLTGSVTIYKDEDYVSGSVRYRTVAESKPLEGNGGVKCILHTEVDTSGIQALGMLGLINPAEIVWELVPWSFVVDWFVPVGTFLSACTGFLGQKFVSGTSTSWLDLDVQFQCAEGSGLAHRERVSYPEVSYQVFQYERAVIPGFSLPRIYGRRSLSTDKVITAAALWRSLMR